MGQNNFLKIFSILAWAVFAAVSCWATSESLFLSFSGGAAYPKIIFWIIVVGFYVLTSIGTKWVVEGVSGADVDNKKAKLFGGLIIIAFFWIAISMPTNAHTFLYKKAAKSVAQKEVIYLQGQLQMVSDIETFTHSLRSDFDARMAEVDQLTQSLTEEIRHPDRPGFDTKSEKILQDIETILGVKIGTIVRKKPLNSSEREINRCTQYYTNAIRDHKEIAENNAANAWARLIKDFENKVKDAKKSEKYLAAVYKALNDEDVAQEEVLKEARKQINSAYDILDKNAPDGAVSSRDKYVNVEKNMPSSRLINVVEVVWKDYLHGDLQTKYDMQELKGMIYYVLLSILVDFAAFLFFNIGFKKEDY